MKFETMKREMQKHFKKMTKESNGHLFQVNTDKDLLYAYYLDSFPDGTNEIFRKRREYDCSCCRQFIRAVGDVVSICNGKVNTIWDVSCGDTDTDAVCNAMSEYIKGHIVASVFVSKDKKVGTDFNYELIDNKSHKWTHFFLTLDDCLVDKSNRSIEEIQGRYRDNRNVFKRSLDEITIESVDTILDLISSNSLYKGKEWEYTLKTFKKYKTDYEKLITDSEKELYAWEHSCTLEPAVAKIRNHSIGTLLVNISNNMDLDTAVRKYEQIVAPANYKRPKAIYTKKMLDAAKKMLTDMGYIDSLKRRFATLDDITVNNILFSNKDVAKRIIGSDDIFGQMENEVNLNPKRFSRVEEISVSDFVENILPNAKEISVFVENKHARNFVSLTAPVNHNSKSMFKWSNAIGWAYTGNITDSDMKQNVKDAGGNVDGVLRFSIQWNEDGKDNSDLDAHCMHPDCREIFFGSYKRPNISSLSGQLDVDITHPVSQRPNSPAIENIVFTDKSKMVPGMYRFFVNQYSERGNKGFKAEIEFDGEIHSFEYNRPVRQNRNVDVADVILDKDGKFSITEKIPGNGSINSQTIWNITTNQFVPVSVICYSPNYFDNQDSCGHRHLFFMLKDCINPEEPNGIFNEYLKNELNEHKHVMEALGEKCHVVDADDQLSGIGFSMTKRADLLVKVKGSTERIMKVKF